MGLRPARCYRVWRRAYTRISVRVPRKSYIKGVPGIKLRIFEMGTKDNEYSHVLHLISRERVQIRHNALEAARVMANSFLRKKIGDKQYFMKIRIYPHQVLREHAQAAVAQADRYYRGMSKPFGRPVGKAARVDAGQKIMSIWINEENLDLAKRALKRAAHKLPGSWDIVIEEFGGRVQ